MWFFKNCISILSIAVLVSCDSDFFGARGRNGRHNRNHNHRSQGRRGRQNSDLDLPEPVQVKSKSNPINSRPCEIFLADFCISALLKVGPPAFFGARGCNGRHNHNCNHRSQGRRGQQNSNLDLPEPFQVN